MNIKEIEKVEGKVCTKCGVWKPLEEYNKRKDRKSGRKSECRECQKEYNKQWRENNPKYSKQWYENNPEYNKRWNENNKEHKKEQNKQWRESNKQNNLQYIFSIVEQINPTFKKLNLPVYGYVYMFENIKTGHVYVGQTTNSLKERYKNSNIIQGWIEHRKSFKNQKFTEELIEEDFKITETLDVAFCQYHLDKLEAYYINKYNSCENGYNNEYGNHNTDNGLDEFNQILAEYNLEFKDGKLIQIKAPTNK